MESNKYLNGLLTMPQSNGLLGLSPYYSQQSIAPFGIRHDGLGAKGKGFFGMLGTSQGQFATELSASEDINGRNVEFPLLVPTLNHLQIQSLLAGKAPTNDIYQNALAHALKRIQAGLSPFAQPNELRYPLPPEQ